MAKGLEQLLLDTFLIRGEKRMRPGIPSRQMQKMLNRYIVNKNTGCINVPHYWAVIIHEGRGPSPKSGPGLLIWFSDPKNDPRLRNGKYPVTRADVRHLTKAEFQRGVKRNRPIIAEYLRRTGKRARDLTSSDYRNMNLYMIVAKRSPGSGGGVLGNPFMANNGGMRGFGESMSTVGGRIGSKFITDKLKADGILNKSIVRTVRL
ncbi:MAG: hypothetical protein GY845_25895 [Planctomycetes bacterium]|nr:hypothetical protein [Planctomycetota bacterium]